MIKMKNRIFIKLIITPILILSLFGCTKSEKLLEPYLSRENMYFSVLILAEQEDFMDRTTELNKLIQDHPIQVNKAGVLIEGQKDCKMMMEYLNIDIEDLPVYILLDNKKIQLVNNDFEEFQQKMMEIIQKSEM